MSAMVAALYSRAPAWVSTGTIEAAEAAVLASLVCESKPQILVETGTASGLSTAVLATAAGQHGNDWELHTVDAMEVCYFDNSRTIGQAALEMLGDLPNIHFHRSCTALDIQRILGGREADFVFVDASHASPWAAADLLGVLPNLRVGAIVALHDVLLPFKPGYAHQNGPRDLFRTWRGQKWVEPSAPNLGFLRFTDLRQALTDIAACLQADWDIPRDLDAIAGFASLLRPFEGVDYPGKDACWTHFGRCSPEVVNGNRYTRLSSYPFASASIVHPNHAGNDVRIVWRKLPTNATHLQVSACAGNPSMQNPGAVLHVHTVTDGTTKTVALPPRVVKFIDVRADRNGSIDLEVVVARASGHTAEYAGVTLSQFTLRNGFIQ